MLIIRNKIKIIYMGTPDFAVPALNSLCKNGYEIALVVTRPDRPKGRGRKIVHTPVKEAAIRLGCKVFQPESVKSAEFADTIASLEPDILVVTAFGHILPQNILLIPRLGTINIHASLLPEYRGPAPIQWAIINREKETGVTTMLLDKGIDTGDILLKVKTEITQDDTSGTLHDRLAYLGADLLIKTLKTMESVGIRPVPQNISIASYAPAFKKNDGRINWEKPAENIEAFVRGMSPWPGAFTFHKDKRLKIFKVKTDSAHVDEKPGTIIKGFPDELSVATGKGTVCIMEIQGASGKRLVIKNFLQGNRILPGTVLS